MPDNAVIQQTDRKYNDIDAVIPHTDPYNKKEFYPVVPSKKNIDNDNVFLVDMDDNGTPVFATYEKDNPNIEYRRQVVRKYEDGEEKVFPISGRMDQVFFGKNPFQGREYLQDYNPMPYSDQSLNNRIGEIRKKHNPKLVAAATPEQRGAEMIDKLKPSM